MKRPAPRRRRAATSAGRLLREAREKQGLHIAALAAAIKVSPKKLELLESDRFDALARRHLHPGSGADRLPGAEDRPGAGDAAPAAAVGTPARDRRRGPEHAVSRAAGRAGAERLAGGRSRARATGSPGCCWSGRSRCSSFPPGGSALRAVRVRHRRRSRAKVEPGMPPDGGRRGRPRGERRGAGGVGRHPGGGTQPSAGSSPAPTPAVPVSRATPPRRRPRRSSPPPRRARRLRRSMPARCRRA